MYWKRYGRKTPTRACDLAQIKQFGRLILEALNFIYENGLVYGHLHSGNILFDPDQALPIKLLDIANAITGVSSKYRCYVSNLRQIRVCRETAVFNSTSVLFLQTLEQSDVYGFGRVIYEMACGEECPTTVCIQFPSAIPIPAQHVLLRILAPTGDLPTIAELLSDPYALFHRCLLLMCGEFSFFQLPTSNNIERFQIKLSPKAKEAFEQIARTAQNRLEGEQTKVPFTSR